MRSQGSAVSHPTARGLAVSFRPNRIRSSATHRIAGAQERVGRAAHVGPRGTPICSHARGRAPYERGAHAGERGERDVDPLPAHVVFRAQDEGAARVESNMGINQL